MIEKRFDGRLLKTGNTRVNIPVSISLGFDPDEDPLSVGMLVDTGEDDGVVWVFGRQLLANSLHCSVKTGLGDVKMQRQGQWLVVCLSNPHGHADLGLPAADVQAFLDDSVRAVPLGNEDCDSLVDAFLEEVFKP